MLTLTDPVIPAVAILSAIVKQIPSARFCLEKRRVREWQRRYFDWFEKEFVPVNGPCDEYQDNIRTEFRSLLRNLRVEDLEADT